MARSFSLDPRPHGLSLWRCCCRKRKCSITKEMAKIYVAIFIAMICSAYSITMLFPFLPFMVRFLEPDLDETSIGKYAGIIASSMFFGRMFGSYIWGALADYKGRKPVILISLLLLGLSSAAFGFSTNMAMAVCFRFGVGLFNGIVGTCKAVIGETSDDSNQALGISMLAGAWGLGFIIGPAISGAIADPIGQYNLTISDPGLHSFLTRFPYSLPCLFNLLLCLAGIVVVVCLLPETLGSKHNRKKEIELLADEDKSTSLSSEDHTPCPSPYPITVSQEDEEACEDVDLGMLGRRPFATGEDNHERRRRSGSDSRRRSSPDILEAILEDEDDDGLEGSNPDASLLFTGQDEDSGVFVQLNSTGGSVKGSPDQAIPQYSILSSNGEKEGACQKEFTRLSATERGDYEDVDLGELHGSLQPVGIDHDQRPASSSTGSGRRSSMRGKHRRRSSFLVPFFNRRQSFSLAFVKPSLSALRRQHTHEREGPEEEGEGPEGDREKLITEETEKLSVWKKFLRWIKGTLLDLKLFFCDRVTLLSLVAYCVFSFAVIGFDEVYSLWASTSPDLGGLGWSLSKIGLSLAITGGLMLPFILFLYPALEKRFGSIKSFYIGAIPTIVLVMSLPTLHYLVPLGLIPLLWVLLVGLMTAVRTAVAVEFACLSIFMNNSVTYNKLGSLNGLATAMTAAFRTVAPLFAGSVYSASLSETSRDIGYPLDYHLIFILFGFIFLVVNVLVAMLPHSINRQKVVE